MYKLKSQCDSVTSWNRNAIRRLNLDQSVEGRESSLSEEETGNASEKWHVMKCALGVIDLNLLADRATISTLSKITKLIFHLNTIQICTGSKENLFQTIRFPSKRAKQNPRIQNKIYQINIPSYHTVHTQIMNINTIPVKLYDVFVSIRIIVEFYLSNKNDGIAQIGHPFMERY